MRSIRITNPNDHLVVIPWSGGFDSTFLLVEELHKGNEVVPIYFNYQNLGKEKLQAERLSRRILRSFITNKILSPDNRRLFREDEIVDLDIHHNAQNSIHCPQTTLFVPQASYLVRSTHMRDIARGRQIVVKWPFVMRDDANSFLPEIKRLFDVVGTMENEPTNARIDFPISHLMKTELFMRLHKRGLPIHRLLSYTHTCEMPMIQTKYPFVRIRSCGECKPCVSHKFDFGELESDRRYNPGKTFLLNNGAPAFGENPVIKNILLLSSVDHPKWIARADSLFEQIIKRLDAEITSWRLEEIDWKSTKVTVG